MGETGSAILLLVLPAIAWGGMFHVAQRVLPVVDPFWLTLLRFLPTSLVMVALLSVRESPLPARASDNHKTAVAGLLGFAVFSFSVYSGIAMTTPEHGAIIMSLTPLIGALLAWGIGRHRPTMLSLICIGVALLGAFLVVTGGARVEASSNALLGDGLVFLGALAWALYLRSGGWFPGWSSLRFSTLSTAAGTAWIVLGVAGFSAAGWAHMPDWHGLQPLWPELFYLVVFGTLIALLMWNRGVALLGPVNGALFMNLVPVSAFAIGLLRGHRPTAMELFGAALVLAALVINNVLPRRGVAVAR
jgi:drug/metabolite transporter (DMT)-like permease